MHLNGMNKWVVALVLLGVVVFMGTKWNGSGNSENARGDLTTISKRSFDVVVKTVGVLDAARSHMVSSTIKGDKGKIVYLIEDGSHVKEGDALVKLDAAPFEEEMHQLEDELKRLESALDATRQILEWEKNQVEREIKTAEFNVKVAKLEFEKLVLGDGPIQLTQFRTEVLKVKEEFEKYTSYVAELEKLHQRGFDHRTEIALANMKTTELKEKLSAAEEKYNSYANHVFPSLKETAKAKIENAEMEHEQIKNGSVYKIAKAISVVNETQSTIDSTKAALLRTKKEFGKTAITAPYSGIAILFEAFRDGQKRKPRVGDKVWQNQPLLYLPDISSMIIKTQVREIDLHKIFLDQPCTIHVDAYPEVLFEGEVMFIGVLATDRFQGGMGEKYFQVTIAVKGNDMRLRPGMTSRVTLINEQLKDILSVPVQAVFNEVGEKYCYQYEQGGFKKTMVSIGRQNEYFAEILSGLRGGDQVSLIKPSLKEIN